MLGRIPIITDHNSFLCAVTVALILHNSDRHAWSFINGRMEYTRYKKVEGIPEVANDQACGELFPRLKCRRDKLLSWLPAEKRRHRSLIPQTSYYYWQLLNGWIPDPILLQGSGFNPFPKPYCNQVHAAWPPAYCTLGFCYPGYGLGCFLVAS